MSDTIISPKIDATVDTTIITVHSYNTQPFGSGLYGVDYIPQPVAVNAIISDDPSTCPAQSTITDENWCGT